MECWCGHFSDLCAVYASTFGLLPPFYHTFPNGSIWKSHPGLHNKGVVFIFLCYVWADIFNICVNLGVEFVCHRNWGWTPSWSLVPSYKHNRTFFSFLGTSEISDCGCFHWAWSLAVFKGKSDNEVVPHRNELLCIKRDDRGLYRQVLCCKGRLSFLKVLQLYVWKCFPTPWISLKGVYTASSCHPLENQTASISGLNLQSLQISRIIGWGALS